MSKKPKYQLETPETRAKFEAIRAKHGLRSKKKHIVTSYLTSDGRIVTRFGPNELLVVMGSRQTNLHL